MGDLDMQYPNQSPSRTYPDRTVGRFSSREPPLFIDIFRAWLVRLVALPILLLTCLVVTSAGIRDIFDIGGTPLAKWFPQLTGYQETRRLDFAHVMAFGLMIGVWSACETLSRSLHWPVDSSSVLDTVKRYICFGLLGTDSIFFWLGLKAGSGFLVSAGMSFLSASIATIVYVLMLFFTAFKITELERGRR